MLLQREKKKELWRFASKNCVTGNQGSQTVSIRYHIGSNQKEQKLWPSLEESCVDVCSSSFLLKSEHSLCSTPPPPYSCLDFVAHSETSSINPITSAKPLCQNGRKYHKKIESDASIEHIINSEIYPCSSTSSETRDQHIENINDYRLLLPNMLKMSEDDGVLNSIASSSSTSSLRTSNRSISINLGETVINIFRYCFTCGFLSKKNDHDICIMKTPVSKKAALSISHSTSLDTVEKSVKINQDFQLLIKNLKSYQISLLLEAVKTRKVSHAAHHVILDQQLSCILIKRTLKLNEEPFLLACRLFFWSDLKTAEEIKKIPFCTSENNQEYVCCNPLHWCRIICTDITAPHYDIRERRVFGRESNFRNGDIFVCQLLAKSGSSEISYCEDIPAESCWCDVAYWELSQRVGNRHEIKTTSFNICSENILQMNGKEDICLQKFFNSYQAAPNDVKSVRQKIGLGATISKEKDGVWLYNRSLVPIFLHSPRINGESWFSVWKILPGDCIRAFDFYGNTEYTYHIQYPGIQPGPLDTKTIRFSFLKGWGCGYKRQDITRCPCWFEVSIRNRG